MPINRIIPDSMAKRMAESNVFSAHNKAISWLEYAMTLVEDNEKLEEAIGMALDEIKTARAEH